MNQLEAKTRDALADDGMEIEDYESGANLVFVGGQLLSDSDELDEAQRQLRTAESYGEFDCWIYTVA